MLTHPTTLLPLLALAIALGWSALQPGLAPLAAVLGCTALLVAALLRQSARAQARTQSALTRLEQRLSEQGAALAEANHARATAQAALHASEERYALALRSSQDGQWEWDLEHGAMRLSPRWTGLLGFQPGELDGERGIWRERVHPDDRAALDAALTQHLAEPDSRFEHELRLLHRDGTVRWVLSRGATLRRANGAPYRMVGLDTDVSRVKRVQGLLEQVAEGTAGMHGERFFPALVEHFARALQVDCAFMAECADHPVTRLRTLAWWTADGLRPNFEFDIEGTPCAEVVTEGRVCFHRDGVESMFPREKGYRGYLGMPIVASDGERVLGHLAFMHAAPLDDDMLVHTVYRIFTSRAAAELERLQALARAAMPRTAGY